MKQITILTIVAALLAIGCKSKSAEKPPEPPTATQQGNLEPEAEPEPEPEPEPEAPPPTELGDVDRSCEEDTDCVVTTLIVESGPRLCCVGCELHAVSAEWLAESIRTCSKNAQTKSIKCPPKKCEQPEHNAARCVEGTCESYKAKKGKQLLVAPAAPGSGK